MTRHATDAEFMDGLTMGLSAWNWSAWPEMKARIVKRSANQYGAYYTFVDGSRGVVWTGTARFRAL